MIRKAGIVIGSDSAEKANGREIFEKSGNRKKTSDTKKVRITAAAEPARIRCSRSCGNTRSAILSEVEYLYFSIVLACLLSRLDPVISEQDLSAPSSCPLELTSEMLTELVLRSDAEDKNRFLKCLYAKGTYFRGRADRESHSFTLSVVLGL